MLLLLLLGCVPALIQADFLGSIYPYPSDLNGDRSAVAKAWKERVVEELESYSNDGAQIDTLINFGMENLTFSANLFSLNDPKAQDLQYHHTAPEVANAPEGTNEVDENSIYSTASIAKLFTVYAGMISLSEEEWHRPLSKVFPDVFAGSNTTDAVHRLNFDEITAWSLANHMSGTPYWMVPAFDLLAELATAKVSDATPFGFPLTDLGSLGPCYVVPTGSIHSQCPEADWLANVAEQVPVHQPWSSPEYSNGGMILLGLTIGAIRGKGLQDIWQESVFNPLNMTSTGGNLADDPEKLARGVLGGPLAAPGWTQPATYELGSGAIKTSLADITKLAKAILSSELLPPATTRRWLHPTTLTPSASYAIGAPWEIIRYSNPNTGRITDLYTKSGDAGPHGGIVALIPEYNAGFNVLCENQDSAAKSPAMWALFDHIALHVLPALETQAVTEASKNYAGTYRAAAADVNSSMTIVVDLSTVPLSTGGLSIVGWISNGTDMLLEPLLPFAGEAPKLLPTIQDAAGSGEVAFYATTNVQTASYQAAGTGPFKGLYESNKDSFGISLEAYVGVSVREVVFSVDERGMATKVRPLALKTDLERVQ